VNSAGSVRYIFLDSRLCRAVTSGANNDMKTPSRKIDRKKIFAGVFFICLAVLLMLLGEEHASPTFQAIWVSLLGWGVFLYLWGRFFSRGED
jgi:hypothetical protein